MTNHAFPRVPIMASSAEVERVRRRRALLVETAPAVEAIARAARAHRRLRRKAWLLEKVVTAGATLRRYLRVAP